MTSRSRDGSRAHRRRTRVAPGQLATAGAVIDGFRSSDSGELSGLLVHELLEGVGRLTTVLAASDTAERQRVYRAVGVHLRDHRTEEGEKITAALRVGMVSEDRLTP
jgi:hypothetical protein